MGRAGWLRPMMLIVCALAGVGEAGAQERPDVQGMEAAVVADHPLAAAAGAAVLRRGGNAVDAAITMAAVLAVVRPHMNGVGGDAFMLIREGRSGRVHALNGSGRAGENATIAAFRARGHESMPRTGVLAVTVPGAVRAWSDALRRHGTISLADALAPAIRLAELGFPVSEKLAADIAASAGRLADDTVAAAVFLPGGRAPEPRTLLRQPDLARTLQEIAREGADALYTGDVAMRFARFMTAAEGMITIGDLAQHSSTWQQPLATTYAGFRVLAFPPNTQGIALLLQMNMAENFELRDMGHNEADYIHTIAGITRIAFGERDRHVTDPAFAEIPIDHLLSREHARDLTARWHTTGSGGARAEVSDTSGGAAGDGDTVFLGVVDANGNAVALIQSLYNAFGSGRMIPGTGIMLHNRGGLFSLQPGHINAIAPRKRTYHTLSPAMALNADGSLFMVFGSPGSDGQTQTQLQVFNNVVLFGMSPQRAVEAPRWRLYDTGRLQVESGIGPAVRDRVAGLGHRVTVEETRSAELGGAQIIMILPGGIRAVGADPRREAYGIAW